MDAVLKPPGIVCMERGHCGFRPDFLRACRFEICFLDVVPGERKYPASGHLMAPAKNM